MAVVYKKIGIGIFLVFILSGCQISQKINEPNLKILDQYDEKHQESFYSFKWSDYINDPILIDIVNLALENNADLKIASLRISEAQAAYGIQRSDLFPSISGDAYYDRNRVPKDLSGVGTVVKSDQYFIGLGLNQWELDLWGRIRSLNEAALESFFATQYNQLAVRNSIIQQSVISYLTLCELEKRIHFANRSVENYEKSVRIFKRRYEVGAGSKVEYMQAQTLLSNAQAVVTQLQKSRDLTSNYLVQLIGVPVQIPKPELDQVTFKNKGLRIGLPSDLLLNRPDIKSAEASLKSKNANIYAARAAFFPRIALTGSFGTSSSDLDGLFKSGSALWSFTPSISIPIFTAGRLKNNVNLAEIRHEISIAEYEKSVQNAFREVADALSEQRYLDEQLKVQFKGLDAFRETARLTQLQYDSGAIGYLDVLDAQRNLFSAEQQWIETQSLLMQSYVNLYFALGGDTTWR